MAKPVNYIRMLVKFACPSKAQMWCTLYYATAGGYSGSLNGIERALAVLDQFSTQVVPKFADCLTTECSVSGVICELHSPEGVFTQGLYTDVSGTVGGDTCPSYTAVVIQRRTNVPGKSGRGRIYVPCVPEASTDDSYLSDLTKHQALIVALMINMDVEETTFVPQHYSPRLDSMTPVAFWVLDSVLGTMRTRKVKTVI